MATPRHAWQRPRPPRHALQRPRHALQRPRPPWHAFSQGPRSPTSKKNPPTCCLISCEVKGVVYHQVSYMEAWWCQKERGLEDSKIIALGHIRGDFLYRIRV